jgi:hypothetical protein
MELKEYKKKSHEYSGKASDLARQINYAGLGIIWIIISTNITVISLKNSLTLFPLILISISLFFDFAQYFIGGIIWIRFYKNNEKKGIGKNDDILSAKWRSNVLYFFYYSKFILTITAYIFIFIALIKRF